MSVREVLLLGNPRLYEGCTPVEKDQVRSLGPIVQDMHDTLMDFRCKYGAGRAIAAPQIGVIPYSFALRSQKHFLEEFSARNAECWSEVIGIL